MTKKTKIWEDAPAKEDYVAAEKYLTLLFKPERAKQMGAALKAVPTTDYAAKDLLRASQTHLLDKDNPHVADTLKRIRKKKKVSPVLLIRGIGGDGVTLTIADGHHRICASWYWDEDVPVACCIADDPEESRSARRRRRR